MEHSKARQVRTGQGRAGQGRAGQGRRRQGRTLRSRENQAKLGQGRGGKCIKLTGPVVPIYSKSFSGLTNSTSCSTARAVACLVSGG